MGFKGCIFEGPPPEGFSSWSEWTEADTKTGVKIKALRGQKNSAPDKDKTCPCGCGGIAGKQCFKQEANNGD